jgi:hypothetical protein
MSDRVLWFLLGAGALYLIAGRGAAGGIGGGVSVNLGGHVGASIPPDQRWQRRQVGTDVEGTWDPMGAPTWYKVETKEDGNMVMSGGGLN